MPPPIPTPVRSRRGLVTPDLQMYKCFAPSCNSLEDLARYILDSRDPNPHISYAVVDALNPNQIPTTNYDPTHAPTHDKVQMAMGAMLVISSQARVIHDSHAPRQEMVALLKVHYLDFLAWLQFFGDKGIFVISGAEFVLAMLDMDEGLENAFMESPFAVDWVFNLLMQRDERGRYHFPSGGEIACPLLLLTWRMAASSRGVGTIRVQLKRSPSEIRCIAEAFQGRLRVLRKGHSKGVFSPSFTMGQLRGLSRVIECLLYQPDHFEVLFNSHRLVYEISSTLNKCLHEEADPALWFYSSDVLGSLYTFLLKSGLRSGNLSSRIVSALHGGLIRVLLKTLLHTPASHTNYPFFGQFLRDIVGYIAYRSVAPYLVVFVSSEYYATVQGAKRPPKAFKQCWQEILCAVKAYNKYDGPRIMSSVCDNVQHDDVHTGSEVKSMICSGCRVRSYCSRRCQREDWTARHRQECNEMHLRTLAEADMGRDLRFSARADLAGVVERACNAHINEFESYAQRSFSTPLGSLVFTINGISVPATYGLLTVVRLVNKIKASFGDNITQRQRINDHLTQMLGTPDIHLAYAVFPLGLARVHILVRLRKDGNSALRVLSFLTIGISECRVADAQHIWSARDFDL